MSKSNYNYYVFTFIEDNKDNKINGYNVANMINLSNLKHINVNHLWYTDKTHLFLGVEKDKSEVPIIDEIINDIIKTMNGEGENVNQIITTFEEETGFLPVEIEGIQEEQGILYFKTLYYFNKQMMIDENGIKVRNNVKVLKPKIWNEIDIEIKDLKSGTNQAKDDRRDIATNSRIINPYITDIFQISQQQRNFIKEVNNYLNVKLDSEKYDKTKENNLSFLKKLKLSAKNTEAYVIPINIKIIDVKKFTKISKIKAGFYPEITYSDEIKTKKQKEDENKKEKRKKCNKRLESYGIIKMLGMNEEEEKDDDDDESEKSYVDDLKTSFFNSVFFQAFKNMHNDGAIFSEQFTELFNKVSEQ